MSPRATPDFAADYTDILGIPTASELDVLADELDIQLNGGQASSDSAYDWPYLRLCVQQAADVETSDVETKNQALLQADYLTRKKDEVESHFTDLKAKQEFWETPERWIQSFPAPLLYDADRQEQYFILPPAFVNLRRYQNLPAEDAVRDVVPKNRVARNKYRFLYLSTGRTAYSRQPGGLLGRWGYYREQTTPTRAETEAGAILANQHRCYLVSPKPGQQIPDSVPLLMYVVIRDSRTSGLPAPPLILVQNFNIVRRALELALLRTKMDKDIDAGPTATQQ